MYTRVTSPLRRFDDLLLHWQLHAALAEEERLGRSLKGEDCSEAPFLAFSRQRLGELLMEQVYRAKIHRSMDKVVGPEQWIRAAMVRAWKFGEAEIPERIVFSVNEVKRMSLTGKGRPTVEGTLNWFSRPAFLDPDTLHDHVARIDDLRPGDKFEVEINDLYLDSRASKVSVLRPVPT
jgi:RNB domain